MFSAISSLFGSKPKPIAPKPEPTEQEIKRMLVVATVKLIAALIFCDDEEYVQTQYFKPGVPKKIFYNPLSRKLECDYNGLMFFVAINRIF